jgi:hypothetical protein
LKYIFAALSALLGMPACADTYAPIKDVTAFLQIVEGRDLRIGLYDLTLNLAPDGQITGSALGWSISGTWRWDGNFFCRQMDWSGYAIEDNCQLVEALGTEKLRFTTDQGAGDSATFKLR